MLCATQAGRSRGEAAPCRLVFDERMRQLSLLPALPAITNEPDGEFAWEGRACPYPYRAWRLLRKGSILNSNQGVFCGTSLEARPSLFWLEVALGETGCGINVLSPSALLTPDASAAEKHCNIFVI